VKVGFAEKPAKAAKGLTAALNAAEDRRAYRRGWSQDKLFRVLNDDQTISFNQLGSLGLFYGVPMALISIFTQLRSEMTNFDKERAQRTLQAFMAAIVSLEQIVSEAPEGKDGYEALPHDSFLEVRQRYVETFGEFQPALPLGAPGGG
jgi:hypothetical protein